MKITLSLTDENGKEIEKEFKSVRLKGRTFKQVLEIKDKLAKVEEEEFSEENVDDLVKIVTLLFGNQFTADEFYDGVYAEDVLPICRQAQNEIGGSVMSKMGDIVKN
ncbi:MAG: hypothetical protein Q8936_16770 [Bacillota bacterium]|nr:hypothetical protein [Bacillota bacterium]